MSKGNPMRAMMQLQLRDRMAVLGSFTGGMWASRVAIKGVLTTRTGGLTLFESTETMPLQSRQTHDADARSRGPSELSAWATTP